MKKNNKLNEAKQIFDYGLVRNTIMRYRGYPPSPFPLSTNPMRIAPPSTALHRLIWYTALEMPGGSSP
jgi:hypothetical protein